MQLPITIYKDENGMLIAECSLLPGFHTYGKDHNELETNLQELEKLYEEMIENNEISLPHQQFVGMSFLQLSSHHLKNVRISN